MKDAVQTLLDKGHIYLKEYRIIAITIVFFFMWQTYVLTEWYMEHFIKLKDWQNAPVVGLIGGYVTALKFALEHILKDDEGTK
jgi:hypothetical protein